MDEREKPMSEKTLKMWLRDAKATADLSETLVEGLGYWVEQGWAEPVSAKCSRRAA